MMYNTYLQASRQNLCEIALSKILLLHPHLSIERISVEDFVDYAQAEIRTELDYSKIIRITNPMLDLIDNMDQLILLIGHELGHILFEPSYEANLLCRVENHENAQEYEKCTKCTLQLKRNYAAYRRAELKCDLFGYNLVKDCGYDQARALVLWCKLNKTVQDRHMWSSHPTWKQRIRYCLENVE